MTLHTLTTKQRRDMGNVNLRDYFAINAMTGLTLCDMEVSIFIRASLSYKISDAMLKVRKKENSNLTLRDIFASQAQLGLCAFGELYTNNAMALKAYKISDAMLKAKKNINK